MTKFVSFARNLEDVVLRRALADIDNGFYIDLGASDNDCNSVTRAFYELGWHGINVTSDRYAAGKLGRRLRDVSLCCALDGNAQSVIRAEGTESPDGTHWKHHLLAKQEVHFARIDVDLVAEDALEGLFRTENRPWIILLSSHAPADLRNAKLDACERHVLGHGYTATYSDSMNRFYLSAERSDLAERFPVRSIGSDDFARGREKELEAEVFRLKSELACASTSKREVVQLYKKLLETKGGQAGLTKDTFREQPLLRRLNPERIIRRAIRRRFPKKPDIGKLHFPDTPMLSIELEDFTLNFATNALKDERGVGRVAKEQLKALQKRQAPLRSEEMAGTSSRPAINFFPSIHWCPAILPPNSVLMIHDVIPLVLPHVFPDHIVREWIYKFSAIAESASHIVTISNSSATDIAAVLDIPREKISVIHNGVDISGWDDESEAKIALPSEPYFVCIGSRDYHKNLDVVYQAICLPEAQDCRLLVVGNGFERTGQKVDPMIKERVRFLGRLSDRDLAHVLKNARALLFPSIYEGFGLPPLEAALLGVPTIASARPAMTEVLTQGVHFCEPHDPLEWALAMKACLAKNRDEEEAERLKRHVAENFNWGISVGELLQVIRGLPQLSQTKQARPPLIASFGQT